MSVQHELLFTKLFEMYYSYVKSGGSPGEVVSERFSKYSVTTRSITMVKKIKGNGHCLPAVKLHLRQNKYHHRSEGASSLPLLPMLLLVALFVTRGQVPAAAAAFSSSSAVSQSGLRFIAEFPDSRAAAAAFTAAADSGSMEAGQVVVMTSPEEERYDGKAALYSSKINRRVLLRGSRNPPVLNRFKWRQLLDEEAPPNNSTDNDNSTAEDNDHRMDVDHENNNNDDDDNGKDDDNIIRSTNVEEEDDSTNNNDEKADEDTSNDDDNENYDADDNAGVDKDVLLPTDESEVMVASGTGGGSNNATVAAVTVSAATKDDSITTTSTQILDVAEATAAHENEDEGGNGKNEATAATSNNLDSVKEGLLVETTAEMDITKNDNDDDADTNDEYITLEPGAEGGITALEGEIINIEEEIEGACVLWS